MRMLVERRLEFYCPSFFQVILLYIFPCGGQPIQSDWYLTYYEEKQSQPESAISEKMSYIAYMNQQKAYCELQSAAAESKYGS